jgi:hypothetical protein
VHGYQDLVDQQNLTGSGKCMIKGDRNVNVINNNFNIIHNFVGVPQGVHSDSVDEEAHVERTGRSVTN